MKRMLAIIVIAAMGGGCAAWQGDGGRAVAPSVATATEHLHFMDELRAADTDTLAAIGETLADAMVAEPVSDDRRLRHALWLAAPGHAGHDLEAALARLDPLANADADLAPATRALVRQQREQLQQLQRLRAVVRERDELRARIRALREIEQQIDGTGGAP